MTSIEVKPDALESAGGQLLQLSHTLSAVRVLAAGLDVDASGSAVAFITAELDSVRADMEVAYASGGTADQLLDGAAKALIDTATDFRDTDVRQRAEYDAHAATIGAGPSGGDTDNSTISEAAEVDFYEYYGQFGTLPGNDFDSYDTWMSIRDKFDEVTSLAFIDDALGGLGLPRPIAEFMEKFEADWPKIGVAVACIERIATYWSSVCSDLIELSDDIPRYWKGEAADAAIAWMASLRESLREHSSALRGLSERITAEAIALYEALQTIVGFIEDIIDLIPDPDSVIGFIKDTALAPLKAGKLLNGIQVLYSGFELLSTGCTAIVAAFSQLTRFEDTDFPRIPSYELPTG